MLVVTFFPQQEPVILLAERLAFHLGIVALSCVTQLQLRIQEICFLCCHMHSLKAIQFFSS